ncbi:MAG: head GIN domain-containing protein [Bacteroidota bacterium]
MKTIERPQIVISSALFILLAVILLMLTTTGCIRERIEGNYNLQTKERTSGPFTGVESKGSFRVEIIPDNDTWIEVKAESNVIPYIETWTDGNTLTVEYRQGYNIREHYPVEVFLHTPELESIRISGSGRVVSGSFDSPRADIHISGSGSIDCAFETNHLEAVISGSGNLMISGTADETELRISGSGNIQSLDLLQYNCSADISGSGNIKASVSHALDARISGSGCVYYIGDPVVTAHISGSGRVVKY